MIGSLMDSLGSFAELFGEAAGLIRVYIASVEFPARHCIEILLASERQIACPILQMRLCCLCALLNHFLPLREEKIGGSQHNAGVLIPFNQGAAHSDVCYPLNRVAQLLCSFFRLC